MASRYEPEIERVPDLSGLSLNAARRGENVRVLQRAFLSSYDDDHRHYFGQILGQFAGVTATLANDVLIVIRGQEARIYRTFPLMLNIRPKVAIQPGRAVFQDEILDIEEVRFRDAVYEVDIRDRDKLVWLFRVDWSFGLYFDFSGQSTIPELWKILGECYRAMHFHAVYAFFSDPANPERLIDRGWFPFIQLSTNEFRQLRHGISEPSELDAIEDRIVEAFTTERIDRVTGRWWTNPAFRDKKEIITAGLNAYKENNDEKMINCIKNLMSETEGIVQLHFHRNLGRSPTTRELMEYVSDRGKEAFPTSGSLAFPELFHDYLDTFLFRGFDLADGVELSRHSVAHGVAKAEQYTRTRALQVILSLDQIHHYIMNRTKRGSCG